MLSEDVKWFSNKLLSSETRIMVLHYEEQADRVVVLNDAISYIGKNKNCTVLRGSYGLQPLNDTAAVIFQSSWWTEFQTIINDEEGQSDWMKKMGLSEWQTIKSQEEFAARLQNVEESLNQFMAILSARSIHTKTLLLEQSEIFPCPVVDGQQKTFFRALSRYALNKSDSKIIVSLRTEEYGRFIGQFHRVVVDRTREHYLQK